MSYKESSEGIIEGALGIMKIFLAIVIALVVSGAIFNIDIFNIIPKSEVECLCKCPTDKIYLN